MRVVNNSSFLIIDFTDGYVTMTAAYLTLQVAHVACLCNTGWNRSWIVEELNHASGPSEPPAPQDESPAAAGTAPWEDQLEESLSAGTLRRGELREGVIIDRREDGLLVGIGAKRDGFVPNEDLEKIEDREFNVGDTVPVVVTRFRDSEGNVELSISEAILQEDWLTAEKLLEDQSVYETTVTGANRGGLTVEFGR
ncbi:MAG TPA: S1 RNA-binding domain-containing protein, partial [Chloroflexi bacterium]|nr:S1 RNA-binding domain-containing protein [Chloroflexota bacterium]